MLSDKYILLGKPFICSLRIFNLLHYMPFADFIQQLPFMLATGWVVMLP